jgi:hypothetical protein
MGGMTVKNIVGTIFNVTLQVGRVHSVKQTAILVLRIWVPLLTQSGAPFRPRSLATLVVLEICS